MIESIFPPDAAQSKSPYSPAVRANGFVFVSGCVPVQFETGQPIEADAERQTTIVLTNMDRVLRSAGSSLGRVLKTTVYLANPEDFEGMNRAYRAMFSTQLPARTTISARLIKAQFLVEIDAIALASD